MPFENPYSKVPRHLRHPVQTYMSQKDWEFIARLVLRRGFIANACGQFIQHLITKLREQFPDSTVSGHDASDPAKDAVEQILRVHV